MAKLYFRYGAVSSAKTLNLLAVFHNYGQQQKKAVLIKPKTDTRFGANVVKSRAGLHVEADYILMPNEEIPESALTNTHCILVDEAQFFSASFIEELRDIASSRNIPIICYGLRTDFKTKAFEGSQRLLELADTIEEIKTTCTYCNKKAVFNLKSVDGKPVFKGEQLELGAEEKYVPTCANCYSGFKQQASNKNKDKYTEKTKKI
jgi:thymidine kinase